MARLAGLPARQVTGYSGGTWTGDGYAVYSTDSTTWSEVRLQQNSANGNTDLGWIPFDPCPAAEEIEIVNQTISSLAIVTDTNMVFEAKICYIDVGDGMETKCWW